MKGQGQFCPLEKATPYIGNKNVLSKEIEYKVEIHCCDQIIEKAIKAMKATHPYEVPAYHVLKLTNY